MASLHTNEIRLPAGAWDTHVHIFDTSIGPYAPTRAYTPGQAKLPQLLCFGSSLGTTTRPPNFVIVQPSSYGTDNTVVLSTLQSLRDGGHLHRGIAVVDLDTLADIELQEMHDLGVRGLRLNMQSDGKEIDISAFKAALVAAADRVTRLPGWMVQTFIPGRLWDDIYETLLQLPVTIIADHIGGLRGTSKLPPGEPQGTNQRGFGSLLDLARRKKVIIKISGLYRASSNSASCYDDLAPIVTSLAAEVPDQLIWASDWPHTGEASDRSAAGRDKVEPFREIDNTGILETLRSWVGSEEVWQKMMVSNPGRIYYGDSKAP